MSDDRLQDLLDRYFDGALTEEDRAELERVLLSSPQGRERFWIAARQHADLARWGQEAWGRRLADPDQSPPDKRSLPKTRRMNRLGMPRWAALATAACVALVAVLFLTHGRTPVAVTDPSTASTLPASLPAGVAVLASAVDAQWAEGGWTPGAAIMPGSLLRLDAGAAQVEFFSGARVVLQAPVEIEIRSEMEAFCRQGKVTAHVPPPARGFRLSAERVSVVDLGTEFGLHVPPSGPAEVHVFGGEVEVQPTGQSTPAIKLAAGQAGQVVGNQVRPISSAPQSFLREPDYSRLADTDLRKRREAWQKSVGDLNTDPATLAQYTVSEEQFRGRSIVNLAAGNGGAGSSATIVGCTLVDGRWPLAHGLEFTAAGDRVRLNIDGRFNAVTLLAWIRFDAFPLSYHGLLTPDGQEPGTLRWGITGEGELRLAIARQANKPEPNWEVIMTSSIVTPDLTGRWLLLVSTFDGKRMHHYLNGQLVKEGDAYTPIPIHIGTAQIGGWPGLRSHPSRGRIDQFAVLSRAISPTEIQNVWLAGRPSEGSH